MAKKVVNQIKLQIKAGQANPAPPVGPALGQAGVNIPMFCKEFNARTQPMAADNMVVPVVISVFADRTFAFIVKTPPAANLILKAVKLDKGSGEPNKNLVGFLTSAQVKEIAEKKLPDLNTNDIAAAMRMIEGTARSMGVRVRG